MYRLLSVRSIAQNNFKALTSKNSTTKIGYDLSCRKSFTISHDDIVTIPKLLKKSLNKDVVINKTTTTRELSTTPHVELLRLTKKKRKKPKIKTFTELLEVTTDQAKQTKATVKKLKANQLSEFIYTPATLAAHLNNNFSNLSSRIPIKSQLEYQKYNLDSLDRVDYVSKMIDETPCLFFGKNVDSLKICRGSETVREIMESFQNFKEMSYTEEFPNILPDVGIEIIPPSLSSSPLSAEESRYYDDEIYLSVTEDTLDPLDIDPIPKILNSSFSNTSIPLEQLDLTQPNEKSNKKNNLYKSKYHKSAEIERQAKQHSFNSNLHAYLELCINCNMINRGYAALQNYRYKSKKNNLSVKIFDIKLFNVLMHGYADKGNLSKVREIMSIVKEDGINPTPQSFAAVFECIGRLPDSLENTALLQKYYADATENKITLNHIMDKSIFVSDQREIVLEALQKIDPSFTPVYTPPILTYTNDLLNSLNKTENTNSKIMNPKRGFSADQLHTMGREQLKVELDGHVTVKSIETYPEVTDAVLHYRKKLTEIQDIWKAQICTAFNRDIVTLRHHTNSKQSRAINLYPYLKALDINQYAKILLKEIRTLAEGSETYSPTVGQLYKELGLKAQLRYQMEMKKRNGLLDKTGEIYSLYCDKLGICNDNDNPRQSWQRLIHENRNYGPSMDVTEKAWPLSVQVGVGRFLYNILMRDLKIDINTVRLNSKQQNLMPAFYTLFRNQGRLVKEEVKPHPVLSRLYRGSQQQTLIFDANLVPMMCPPQPWSTSSNGGYIITKSDLIRLPQQAIQQWTRINNAPEPDIYPSLDSLNQLASIPWQVNTPLLDVILEVFSKGGNSKLDVPQPSSSLEPINMPENKAEMTKQEKFQIFRQKLYQRRKQAEMHSLWCDSLYRLSLANHFRDKVFWLPHNMDFRGRVYPLPPHLNHLGSDLARSLLVFHQSQPLGPDGFNWLKLHCVNLTGLKKRDSVIERLLYAEEIMDDILDSADNPLTGRMWWSKSDEPWQTLGCCMEIAKVARCDNPEEYMSSFPIHQDGSCNGLQHYAALGRDSAGAISVNLTPSSIPQDVYSAVAALVENTRLKDEANGVQVAQILDGFVRRKVIKQTVMTTVYGVTRFGARLQIARQLKDIDDFPKEWVWPASTYLTTKTFESLREMFTSTKEIQDWFTDCARLISAVCGQNVEWTTPLGLPVVQPYNRFDKKPVSKLHRGNEHVSMDLFEKPNIMKQKNAFPPNFIHSLDSSHMMLTSLHCEKAGLTFISVHDCFWTHASSVPEMNKICREQFVALHSQPILEDLSKFLVQKYSYSDNEFCDDGSVKDLARRKLNRILMQLPEKGDFDLSNVLKSIYFFS